MRTIIGWIAKLALFLAYQAHKAEGLNALFLILPARFLIPTLCKYGAQIGSDVEMLTPIIFHNVCIKSGHQHYHNLRIGSECYFGKDVFLDLADKIIVEDQVTISMRVMILTHTHAGKSPLSQSRLPPAYAPVQLRKGCYIGAGAILLPGVEIGQEAIVGAGAVVTHNVPAGAVVAGVPAGIIGNK